MNGIYESNLSNQPPLNISGQLSLTPSTRVLTSAPLPLYSKHITIPIYVMRKNKYYAFVPPSYEGGKYTLSDSRYKDWTLITTIYILSYKILPPIPFGCIAYRITNNHKAPYETQSIEWLDNIYKYSYLHTKTSFTIITYKYNVKHTIPLYIYTESHIQIKLKESKKLKEYKVSPLYVMDKGYTKFKCQDGICVPNGFINKSILSMYNKRLDKLLKKLKPLHKKLNKKLIETSKLSSKEYLRLLDLFSKQFDYDEKIYYPPGHLLRCNISCLDELKEKDQTNIYKGDTIVESFEQSNVYPYCGVISLCVLVIIVSLIILKQFKIF